MGLDLLLAFGELLLGLRERVGAGATMTAPAGISPITSSSADHGAWPSRA